MMLQVNACMPAYLLINYFKCNSVLVTIGPTSRSVTREFFSGGVRPSFPNEKGNLPTKKGIFLTIEENF